MNMENIRRTAHKIGFTLKKHSPEILAVVGTAGVVTSTVLACKATTKVKEIVDDHKDQMDAVHEWSEKAKEDTRIDYSEEDAKKDTVIIYTQTSVKLAKLYAPAALVGTVSLGCLLGSNQILRKRTAAFAAAATAAEQGFKEYRKRVAERFGEDVEKEIKLGVKAKEFEKVETDENGNEVTSVETVEVANPNAAYSEYAKVYDDGCAGWCKDPEANLQFLRAQERVATAKLQRVGYVFLNDVYDMLGLPKTSAGQVVGWIYDEENPVGDNYIDFGIFNTSIEKNRDFVNGYENVIVLDFNVDGVIYDKI